MIGEEITYARRLWYHIHLGFVKAMALWVGDTPLLSTVLASSGYGITRLVVSTQLP